MARPLQAEWAVRVEGAVKRFGAIRALDDLSLAVPVGSRVALLGPNGAGKSTLMGAIAGFVRLDAGSIEILDRGDESNAPAGGALHDRAQSDRALPVGYVPQEIALYPLLSVRENLEVFGRIHRLAGRRLRQACTWALDWTGLTSRASDRIETLSGGMRRRVNIACGVLHRPRLVILDEPTVGVDPQARQRIDDMLLSLRLDGATLIESTHELGEIESVCDLVMIMDHGRLLAAGTVDDLIARTLGAGARLHLELDRAPDATVEATHALPGGIEIRGGDLRANLQHVGDELPGILDAVRAAGLGIRGLRVECPTLEAVFTHLTGRGLRE